MLYDVIIIGSGPAGLSAALTLKIRKKSVLIISNTKISKKVQKAHKIVNYLGMPNVAGFDMAQTFYEQIQMFDIEVVTENVTTIYKLENYFSLQTLAGTEYKSTCVILANGMTNEKLLSGEESFLGNGVSYCATCDGPLYKDKQVVVVSQSKEGEQEANFLSQICADVLYIPLYSHNVKNSKLDKKVILFKDFIQGHTKPTFKVYPQINVEKPVELAQDVNPVGFEGSNKAEFLVFDDGRKIKADGFFMLRDFVAPAQLVPGLQIVDGHVEVDMQMCTNLKGCFACGDAAGKPYQFIKAAGQGNVAALSAVNYLFEIS